MYLGLTLTPQHFQYIPVMPMTPHDSSRLPLTFADSPEHLLTFPDPY